MSNEPNWRRYLTFWRPAVDRDVDAEIRFHFEERVADLVARGRTEAQARAEAEGEFGDRDVYRDRMREIDQRVQSRRNRAEWLDVVRGDVRLAWRGMKRSPALSAMVIVTLALGIGANGAIFSMIDRVFLRPPPGVDAPDDVRRLYGLYKAPPPMRDFTRASFNYPEIVDMQAALGDKAKLAGSSAVTLPMGTADDAPEIRVSEVVGDYFGTLGVRPWRGRFFAPEELDVTTPRLLVVLSHRFWSRQLAADTSIIGKTIRLSRRDFTVLGIAPPGFDGIDMDAVDVWRTANARSTGGGEPWYRSRNSSSLMLITRLRDGMTDQQLIHDAMNGLHRASDSRLSTNTTLQVGSIIAARGPREQLKESAIAIRLGGVTLIVLLIAIANVANLLLTRAIERRREIAVRVALGVSRARLAALLITESAVLAVIAGTAALFVATWGAALIRHLLMPNVRWANSPLDLRLALFTFAIALAAGALAGVLPFIRAGKLDLLSAMRGGARDGGAHRSRARGTLIVAQAALSVVLLAGAGLFVRSLSAVYKLDLGYDTNGMMTAIVSSGQRVITTAERSQALFTIRDRIAQVPGVRAAALTNLPPMGGLSSELMFFPGRDSTPRTAGGPPTFTVVTPEFFKAAGVRMLVGRGFTPDDRDGSTPVMVVTETMARFIWGKLDATGACVRMAKPTAPCTIVVGVVKDVRRDKVIEDEMLQYFVPMAQGPAYSRDPYTLVVGTSPERVTAVRQELQSIIRQTLPGSRAAIETMAEALEPQYRPWRIGASLFSVFGLLALLVAAIGVYSAIAYGVTQRSHELGVRMALGAQRSEIGRIVVGSGVKLVGVGVVLGVGIALALSRFVESQLYGTDSRDPAVLTAVGATLLVVAMMAAAIPAWRATRLDPVRALRAE
jgi:predicted permease